MRYLLSFFLLSLFPFQIFCQEERWASLEREKYLENTKYIVYNSGIKIRGSYHFLKEVRNHTPLELLDSEASENSFEWIAFNQGKQVSEVKWDKGDSISLEQKRKIDRALYYFEPIMSIFFIKNGIEYCYLKFYMASDTMAQKFAIDTFYEKNNERWVKGKQSNYNLSSLLQSLNTNTIIALLEGKKNGDSLLNNLIEKTRNRKGGLDIHQLKSWYLKNAKTNSQWKKLILQPFSMAYLEPLEIKEQVEKKGIGLPISELEDYAGGCSSILFDKPQSIDSSNETKLKQLLVQSFSSTTLMQFQQLCYGFQVKNLPVFLKESKLENLSIINFFRTSKSSNNDSSSYIIWRIQDKISKKQFVVKTEIRNKKLYFTANQNFDTLNWLFENLNPKVFHETISYKYNKRYIYTFADLEKDISIYLKEESINSINIDGLFSLFQKYKEQKKYSFCFL